MLVCETSPFGPSFGIANSLCPINELLIILFSFSYFHYLYYFILSLSIIFLFYTFIILFYTFIIALFTIWFFPDGGGTIHSDNKPEMKILSLNPLLSHSVHAYNTFNHTVLCEGIDIFLEETSFHPWGSNFNDTYLLCLPLWGRDYFFPTIPKLLLNSWVPTLLPLMHLT